MTKLSLAKAGFTTFNCDLSFDHLRYKISVLGRKNGITFCSVSNLRNYNDLMRFSYALHGITDTTVLMTKILYPRWCLYIGMEYYCLRPEQIEKLTEIIKNAKKGNDIKTIIKLFFINNGFKIDESTPI
jgi:hypothetical protein